MTTRIAIVGYGNLGRGVETCVNQQADMELVGVFTRRDPATLDTDTPAYRIEEIDQHQIDVAILCGGSATDLIEQTPQIARITNIVDSFDTHARILEHFENVKEATGDDRLAMISSGWDPGLFSVARLIFESVLPNGETTTFWGRGVSQGHSDALRRINGVENAVQYTVPRQSAIDAVANGQGGELTTRDKHDRICYVVAAQGADQDAIRDEIVNMPNYFADYDTEVNFIDAQTFAREHNTMPHGGQVIRRGLTSEGVAQVMRFELALDSNPEFTAAVNVACARAVARAYREGRRGVCTMFDLPLSYLSPTTEADLYRDLL